MRDAREAMSRAVENRSGDSSYELILGRPLTIKDLSATLLLAVHTRINLDDQEMDLVLSCQVGDGMIAAISQGLSMRLLATPDSGVYSGETEFRHPHGSWRTSACAKTPMSSSDRSKLSMLMTDGVSDDYFSDPGMKLLYADLCSNRILPLPALDEAKLKRPLRPGGRQEWIWLFETSSFSALACRVRGPEAADAGTLHSAHVQACRP